MKIIELLITENFDYWLSKINESTWKAGKFLYELIKNNKLKEHTSENVKVFLLVDNFDLVSFCILADKDEIELSNIKPWIGFLYTFEKYRGNRYSSILIKHCEDYAKKLGYQNIYISTNHENLYEKYGYNLYLENVLNIYGSYSQVYIKRLN